MMTRLFALTLPALAVSAASAETVKTAWGDPDLRGTYTSDNSIGVPFERPRELGTRAELTDEEYDRKVSANDEQIAKDRDPLPESEFSAEDPSAINASRHWLERPEVPSRATSMIVDPPDGRIPALTPEGQERTAARRAQRANRGLPASYTDFTNYDRCLTRGLMGSILPVIYGNGTQVEQAPGYVVIRNEMIHEARVIPLGGRHPGPGVKMWMGDSRGRFEGDTLVIETTNFTDRTGIGGNGNGAAHSEDLKLVERLTRVDADTLRYEFTVNDPRIYTKPWTVRFDLDGKPGYEIYEYACHEGNYGLANMLSAARAEERAASTGERPRPASE